MEVLLIALKTTFPLLFTMSIGFAAKFFGLLGKDEISGINKLVYWILLPILLFCSINQPELYKLSNVRLLTFTILGTALVMLSVILIIPRLIKDPAKVGVVIQGLIRGNVLYFGLPVISTLIGQAGLGLISIAIVALVPMYNFVSVIVLEKYTGGQSDFKKMLVQLSKNPLIVSAVLGMLAVVLKIEVPDLVMQSFKNISKATTPTALLLLGAAIELTFTKEDFKMVMGVTLAKLILIPVIMVTLAITFGLTNEEIVTMFAVFAAPTAVASYSLAREMKADYDLSGQIVFMTTMASVVTIFIGTVVLQWLHIV